VLKSDREGLADLKAISLPTRAGSPTFDVGNASKRAKCMETKRTMPDLDDFCTLSGPNADDLRWMWLELSDRAEELGDNAKNRIMDEAYQPSVEGGVLRTNKAIPFRVLRGRRPSDVFGNGCGMAIFSTRLVRALEAARCTGLRTHPAVLRDRRDAKVVDRELHWVKVPIGAGPRDLNRGVSLLSTDIWRTDIEMTGAYGLYFDPASWTGLDIFRFPRGLITLITNRIADVIRAGGFEGVTIEPVREYCKAVRDAKVADLKRTYPNGPPLRPPGLG
jgi:hypothetical protein